MRRISREYLILRIFFEERKLVYFLKNLLIPIIRVENIPMLTIINNRAKTEMFFFEKALALN